MGEPQRGRTGARRVPADRRESRLLASGAGGGRERPGAEGVEHSAAQRGRGTPPPPGATYEGGTCTKLGSPRGGARERRLSPADRREVGEGGARAGGGDGWEPPTGGGRERRVSPADRREVGERGAGRAGGFPR